MGRARGLTRAPAWIRRPRDHTQDGPLLLDTHVWIWYVTGDAARMSTDLVTLLDRRAASASLYVADISIWEVAVKSASGKLVFSIDPTVWLNRAQKAPGIRFLPIDRDVLLLSTRLSGASHNDPADRMLLAAAALHNVPLVTADRVMIEYAAANPGTVVVDARP